MSEHYCLNMSVLSMAGVYSVRQKCMCVWDEVEDEGAATGKAPTSAAESSSHALPLHFGKFFHGLMVSALTGGAFQNSH